MTMTHTPAVSPADVTRCVLHDAVDDARTVAALRAATKAALDDLVRLSETAAWGDIDDTEVDRASAVFVELQDAYNAALIASTKA